MTKNELIEIMVRGVFERYWGNMASFEDQTGKSLGIHRRDVEAALQAAEAAGYTIVPKEPGREMINEGELRYFAFFHSDPPDGLIKEVYQVMLEQSHKEMEG